MLIQKTRRMWSRLRSHVLFIPGAIVLASVAGAVVMVEIDRLIEHESLRRIPWLFRAGAGGARDVLQTVATSVIQLAAITFSVTIVALALRSQQFGPRLLRNFITDKVNQGVLGVFLGTFAYSLLVLRAVRDLGEDADIDAETFIPLLAVTASILLALLCLALFVVFVDRVVSAIQANSIIHEAATETHRSISRLFPEPMGHGPSRADEELEDEDLPMDDPVPVQAPKTGYIESIDLDVLMNVARETDLRLRMEAAIGGFVVDGTTMLTASPSERVDDEVVGQLRDAYTIMRHRSIRHDPEFGIRQIVDVAVKALSPSDNDPTTACTSLDYLAALLIHLGAREIPSRLRRDDEGRTRVLALGPTFQSMADLALSQIREHGETDVAATIQLLDTIARIATEVRQPSHREVLAEHVRKTARGADRNFRDPADRQAVNGRIRTIMDRMGREGHGLADALIPVHGG
jgi:uncharacterized membrane protein